MYVLTWLIFVIAYCIQFHYVQFAKLSVDPYKSRCMLHRSVIIGSLKLISIGPFIFCSVSKFGFTSVVLKTASCIIQIFPAFCWVIDYGQARITSLHSVVLHCKYLWWQYWWLWSSLTNVWNGEVLLSVQCSAGACMSLLG